MYIYIYCMRVHIYTMHICLPNMCTYTYMYTYPLMNNGLEAAYGRSDVAVGVFLGSINNADG